MKFQAPLCIFKDLLLPYFNSVRQAILTKSSPIKIAQYLAWRLQLLDVIAAFKNCNDCPTGPKVLLKIKKVFNDREMAQIGQKITWFLIRNTTEKYHDEIIHQNTAEILDWNDMGGTGDMPIVKGKM